MTIVASAVSVTTTAAALNGEDADGHYGQNIAVQNVGSTDVYLGGSGVTVAAGLKLAAGDVTSVPLEPGEVLYAISATTGSVRVLKQGA